MSTPHNIFGSTEMKNFLMGVVISKSEKHDLAAAILAFYDAKIKATGQDLKDQGIAAWLCEWQAHAIWDGIAELVKKDGEVTVEFKAVPYVTKPKPSVPGISASNSGTKINNFSDELS